jgi:protein involved in polysaccharide export with SLBB domain
MYAQYQLQPDKLEAALSGAQGRTAQTASQQSGMALESTIDPRFYIVGPSDVIAVNIWMSPPVSFSLVVTPEGTLIVPTVGEIPVAGASLANAKELILREVRSRYARADATVTLLTPRPIVVNVLGRVHKPGIYTVTAADRAGRVIELANEVRPGVQGGEPPPPEETMSTRQIMLRHRDGTEERVDIPLFVATKREKLNPLLREGDVIVVPERDPEQNVFGVYGAVSLPGRFELVKGDSLSTALRLSHGLLQNAISDSALFSRLNVEGTEQRTEIVNLGEILSGGGKDRLLEPGDRIVVPSQTELRHDYRVRVEGEVARPGIYPITRDRTRLSDVVRMAGGFTEFASLNTAQLVRRSISKNQVELETLESARGGIASEDSSYYELENLLRIRKEIVSVDFEKLFLGHDSTQDVVVRGEDFVNVPSRRVTVYVFGQVVTSGYVPFVAGESVEYYIQKAGGYTELAREGDVKIVKARTRQWLEPDETAVEPGDYIWVPRVNERSFAYYMSIIGQTASVLSVAVSIVILVLQVNN